MAKIKGKFIKGAAVEGAKAYRLALNLGDSLGGYLFKNNGYIDSNGQVVYMPEKHHTDIIEIDKLVDFNGYCVQHFDINYTDYPKILFFSGNSLDSFISGLTVTELGGKDKLTAAEIKDLAANVVGATHVAFNSDYESGEGDHVYVNDGTYYLELDVKKAEQNFNNFGCIGYSGTGDGSVDEDRTLVKLGERYNVLPLTELGVNGKSYYFRVSVPLKVETTSGIITQTCVGYIYLNTDLVDYFEATRFSFETTEEYDRYIVLVTNLGNIRLAKLDVRYNYNSVVINNPITTGHFWLFHASKSQCHTDFIPIDALTNGFKATVDGVEKEYCVRGFGRAMSKGSPYGEWVMAFYADMDYSTFVYGKRQDIYDAYYTAEEIKAFAYEHSQRPKYVIFVADTEFMQENDCDRVSVGGIWFPLHKYKALEDGDKLAIQAVGENGITLDSFYSEHIEFMREE